MPVVLSRDDGQRLAIGRPGRRRRGTSVVGVVAAGAVAYVLVALFRPGGFDTAPLRAATSAPIVTTPPARLVFVPAPIVTTPATSPPTTRPPRPARPVARISTIWVVGDSLADGLGTALAPVAPARPRTRVVSAGRISTGLTRADYFDWPTALARVVTRRHPSAIVLMLGANDPQPLRAGAGNLVAFGTPLWIMAYRARVDAVMHLAAPTRPIVWVGLPAVDRPDLESDLALLDAIYRQEAARFRWVRYVDTRALFSPGGRFVASLPGPNGVATLVRSSDGVHFTIAGYDRLAAVVMARLRAGRH
jgi:hypothetical protein